MLCVRCSCHCACECAALLLPHLRNIEQWLSVSLFGLDGFVQSAWSRIRSLAEELIEAIVLDLATDNRSSTRVKGERLGVRRADGCAEEYKRIRTIIMGPNGKGKGFMQQMSKQMGNGRGAMNPHNMQMNIQQMSRMLPPQASRPAVLCKQIVLSYVKWGRSTQTIYFAV